MDIKGLTPEQKAELMKDDGLTPEQQRDIFYNGGLRDTVTLAGKDLVLGELAYKDRYRIFECFERDIKATQKAYSDYVSDRRPSLIRAIASIFRWIFGVREKQKTAAEVMRKFVEDVTDSDVALIQICAEGRNGEMTRGQIRELIMKSPYSEVQKAIRSALEINGIDTKKFKAAQEMAIPPAAASTMTSMPGSRRLSNTRDGQDSRS